jgi:hypothetical protein
MLGELEVVVFVKSSESLEHSAERIFGALRTPYQEATAEEFGGRYYEANGMGLHVTLFANTGEMLDPEFETYHYGLEITSRYWCVDLDTIDLEGALSEYYARLLAFELDLETATELLIETTEEAETFEIRAYRRNPQFRLDQSPTTAKVFVVESRLVEEPFEDEDGETWEEDDEEADDREDADEERRP